MWSKIKEVLWRNRVFMVGIPGLAALHYVWWDIQQRDEFVSPTERETFPFVIWYRSFREMINEKTNSETKKEETALK